MLSGHATFVRSQSEKTTTPAGDLLDAERFFLLFRKKVRNCELLSASTMQLLQALGFTGRLTVILHNGTVVKSGYEEGYFRRKDDMRI
jgi:sulfur carrier protein ThiS